MSPQCTAMTRCVGRLEAVLDVQLENAMLGGRIAAIRSQQVLHRVAVRHAVRVQEARSDRERERSARDTQRIRRPGKRAVRRLGAPEHLVEHPSGVDLPLQHRAAQGPLRSRAPSSCSIRMMRSLPRFAAYVNPRPPVAVTDRRVLVKQIRVRGDECHHSMDVVPPDRADQLAGMNEARPLDAW